MALKSSREGLRKELVDYLGNIIIDESLKQNIINSIDEVFAKREDLSSSVNILEEEINNETLSRENADNVLQNNINLETTARQEAISNIEDLINDGVLKFDLLWTNASLASDFASQTISLDLSKYKYFCFSALHYKTELALNEECVMSTIGIVDSYEGALCVTKFNDNAGSRFAKATKTGVIFGNAYANFTTDMTTNNSRTIPYRIYGVK